MMNKEIIEESKSDLYKGFTQSLFIGAKKIVELTAKYALPKELDNAALKKGAQDRLVRLFGYCFVNEQPPTSVAFSRILHESEKDKDLMNALEYDYSDEFERSVNEVLYACFKFFIEIGEALTDEDIEDIEEMIDNADC